MTYGSSEWHRKQGRAIIEHENQMAMAELAYERDSRQFGKLEEGDSVKVIRGELEGETGFISEKYESDKKVAFESWNHAKTIPARFVEKQS